MKLETIILNRVDNQVFTQKGMGPDYSLYVHLLRNEIKALAESYETAIEELEEARQEIERMKK